MLPHLASRVWSRPHPEHLSLLSALPAEGEGRGAHWFAGDSWANPMNLLLMGPVDMYAQILVSPSPYPRGRGPGLLLPTRDALTVQPLTGPLLPSTQPLKCLV